MQTQKKVFKSILANGLTVLIYQKKQASKVALQMWYNVGSKHEQPGQKGMAHFLEHMIFKGTNQKLSESDINMISQKLAAYANAFTSYDYTAYVFDVPVANWSQILPVFADCMQNCSFLQDHMNSEVKAVIQELKMYKDEYSWTLADCMVTNLFEAHPYHYPIIGYKQDLCDIKRESFFEFYKKYYIPNNAALVVVGDIDPHEALQKIEKEFGAIPRGAEIASTEFLFEDTIQAKQINLYRDTEQAFSMLAFVVPGAREKKEFLYDIVGSLLVNGKGSRLYKKLVDDLQLVSSIHAMTYDLFDRAIFFIEFKPKQEKDIDTIKKIILDDIYELSHFEIPENQMRRALKIAQIDYQHMLEDTHKQAYAIGKFFIAIKEENYPFEYCQYDKNTIKQDVQNLLKQYFRSSLCNSGNILNILEQDRELAQTQQEQSDMLDESVLAGKDRTSAVEGGKYVHEVQVEKLQWKHVSAPLEYVLPTGLKVLLYQDNQVDLVECGLRYKADNKYDSKELLGMSNLVAKLMLEGTKKYPGATFIDDAESHGVSLSSQSGLISASMLCEDVFKGLEYIHEMVQNAQLDIFALDRVKNKVRSQLKQFWDTPQRFVGQVAEDIIYQDSPYAYFNLGTEQSLEKISHVACVDFYQKMITPQEAVLVVSGKFDIEMLKEKIDTLFSGWHGDAIADVVYPALQPVEKKNVDIVKQRDQIVMAFAGLSVDRQHPMYDAFVVFDQLLTTGMNSYLFALREQSGLFYTISGSTVYNAGKQPGMMYISTIVSKDRMIEAQKAIQDCIDSSVDRITEQEFEEAKEMVINKFAGIFETNENKVSTLLFLHQYNLSVDYFAQRVANIRNMQLQDVQSFLREYINSKKLVCIKIGRL